MVKTGIFGKWLMYFGPKEYVTNNESGEWLIFFNKDAYDYVASKCKEAVESGILNRAKHSTYEEVCNTGKGVACFMVDNVDGIDKLEHYQVVRFLIDNGFIGKTKSNKYRNIRFKMKSDGKGNHNGEDWNGFQLGDIINLTTGEYSA